MVPKQRIPLLLCSCCTRPSRAQRCLSLALALHLSEAGTGARPGQVSNGGFGAEPASYPHLRPIAYLHSARLSVRLSQSACLCPPVSVRLSLSTCLGPPVSVRLSLSACLCPPASVRLSQSACLCPPVSVRLSLSACLCPPSRPPLCPPLCPPVSVRLTLSACLCPPVSVRLSGFPPATCLVPLLSIRRFQLSPQMPWDPSKRIVF